MGRLRGWLAAQVDAQALRWRLWTPVAFGGGCAAYFALRAEPSLWPLLIAGGALFALWLTARRRGMSRRWTLSLLLVACFALG
ncbi:hypothetical protein CCR92_21710, partial [Rhodospirillum rubrum]|nr:hypothetical protein [Rhodospirillum rubrum]